MINETITSPIKQLTGLSDDELSFVLNRFEEKTILKKTVVLSAGKVAQEIYYVIKGCMRLFYEKNGKDISAYFFTENMFAGAYDSFTSQSPSRHFIETIDDCKILQFHIRTSMHSLMNVLNGMKLSEKFWKNGFYRFIIYLLLKY